MIQIGTLFFDFEQREIRRHGLSLRVGARAFDILEVLVRANGALVSKDDIMDAVWNGEIVEENRLQVHIAALRKLLGADRELIKTIPGRGYLLVSDKQAAGSSFRDDVPSQHGGTLPACTSSLIGRADEIAQIMDLLGRNAVVTLTGAGGIGKTCLAVEVGRAMRERFWETVYFVGFANASGRDDVLAALADVPCFSNGGESSTADASRCLLILDNAEHVIGTIAEFVEKMTARHRGLRVLVTSREPLRIWPEFVFRVDALSVPNSDATVDEIRRHASVELFLCRVKALAPVCAVDERSLRVVGDVCRRLDGLPLAIELAAARVASMGIEGVASRLDDRLNLLTGGADSQLPRHRTLRAAFEWSYGLLDSASKVLFRRLAFFVGPFTFDAVRAVAMDSDVPIASVIAGLDELVTKSLLAVELCGLLARYRLTASTGAYALEKLRDEGEVRLIASRYMCYLQDRFVANEAQGEREAEFA